MNQLDYLIRKHEGADYYQETPTRETKYPWRWAIFYAIPIAIICGGIYLVWG